MLNITNTGAFRRIAKAFGKTTGAFTLVELIVVITILAILATVWFLSLSGYSDDARAATVRANVRTVYSAILTESTTSGNSPRYYVSHDATAALSGAFAFVDGKQVALTGGDLGVGDSNYTAGNPRWDRLRMNGDKFKLAFAGPGVFGGFGALGNEALAAYSTGTLSVGAVDVFKTGANGRRRATPFFQVAAVEPGSKTAVVAGNYAPGAGAGSPGLLRDASSAVASAPLTEPRTTAVVAGDDASGRKWSDGTFAKSCFEYASSPAGRSYAGSVGNGTYWIDPDGAGGNAEFKTYCDMTTDGGGWTRVGYSADLPFQQQFSGGDAWRYLPSNFSLEFSDAQINAIRNASSEGKQTYVHTCDGVIGYYYAGWANYDYSAGFRFHDGTASVMGTGSYSPVSVSVTQDNCKGNGGEGGTMANATIFNITGKYLPVVNVQTRDNGDGGEKFGSPLTSYPAYFR